MTDLQIRVFAPQSGAYHVEARLDESARFDGEARFDTNKGHMLNLAMAFNGLSKHLLRLDWLGSSLSAGECWFVFAAYAALCLLMLSRRVRAYEVVS